MTLTEAQRGYQRAYRARHLEKCRERNREYARAKARALALDPEAADAERARQREYRRSRIDKSRRDTRASWARHREKRLAESAEWYQRNLEHARAANRAYWARNREYKNAMQRAHASKLQAETLPAPNSGKRWTAAEDDVIRGEGSNIEKAHKLGRSYQSVCGRRVKLVDPDRYRAKHLESRRRLHPLTGWIPKTKCPAGHQYSEENTYYNRGHRYCRTCRRIVSSTRSRSEKARAAQVEYRRRNREHVTEVHRQWVARNRDRVDEYQRRQREALKRDPERVQAYNAQRRMRRLAAKEAAS